MNNSSNFWISDEVFNEDIPFENRREIYRNCIKNFVNIVVGKDIPVEYRGKESKTDGKTIWITEEFTDGRLDYLVGVILHESCHIIHTEFDLLKTIWTKIPYHLVSLAEKKKISIRSVEDLYRKMFNYVEDRFIDNWAYENFIGYRGYYIDLYNRYWNNSTIGDLLSGEEFRDECISSYKFRIINFTNKKTDITALKGLEEIKQVLDLDNIGRLKTSKERLEVAQKVCEIILKYSEKEDSKNVSDSSNKLCKKCEDWVDGNFDKIETKKTESDSPKKDFDFLDKIDQRDEIRVDGVKCILIKKLNSETVSNLNLKICKYDTLTKQSMGDYCVKSGISLGKLLATKWKIRREINKTIYNFQNSGKVDKRKLFSVECGNDKVFYRLKTEFFKTTHIHISIDASGSMSDDGCEKWKNAIICSIAIAKAASLTENVECVISFRTSIGREDDEDPCLAIGYDSRVDKLTKMYSVFSKLHPGGSTPEGLLFPLIDKVIPESGADKDVVFINFSDGVPFFQNKSVSYKGLPAATNTAKKFKKLKSNKNLFTLCYYVGDKEIERELFKIMYEKDSYFIDPKQIIEVSKTITKKITNSKSSFL